ncbi:MAG: AsnC family transcriptional regulator [Actinomycetota bacterium]|jgi:DNA-binding Lrp family transcriptional regulator|nr:AsnC family transcriptional regulator [Actinomycetota bacterium]
MPSKTVGRVTLDEADQQLLNILQTAFPLVTRPFEALAARLDLSEGEVMERFTRLKGERIIRQVSAIFDTRKLGYKSSLVATALPEDRVDEAAEIINAHPGVSHNYRRNHEFNLWWTVAVPPEMDLAVHVNALHRLTEARSTRVLPTLKLYKIGVDLDVSDQRAMAAQSVLPAYRETPRTAADLTAEERGYVLELQEDLAVEPTPFASMAQRLGTSEDALVKAAEGLIDEGLMRRFAAVLHHRRAGFGANAMSVWRVPGAEEATGGAGAPDSGDRTDEFGYQLAGYAAVSHCYRRPTYPDWPYALFGMIHATSKERVEEAVADIRQRTDLDDHQLLYSTKEYKKVRVRFFDPAYQQWQDANVAAADAVQPAGS